MFVASIIHALITIIHVNHAKTSISFHASFQNFNTWVDVKHLLF